MREVLSDIVKHTAGLGVIKIIKITGTDTETKVEGHAEDDKSVIVKGKLKMPLPELKGEFGIGMLNVLSGWVHFPNYAVDGASFSVHREKRNGVDVPIEFQFRGADGGGADFRLTSADLVPPQAVISNIVWDVTIVPSKSKLQEFSQLSSLCSEYEKFFTVTTKGDELRFSFGDSTSSSHRATMVFEKGITGQLKNEHLHWPSAQVLSILKLAGANPTTVSFTDRGAMQIAIESDHVVWNYLLPPRRK
jgi:hypothetical protein